MANTLSTPTVIIGAGPAGLAVAACLTRQGQSFVLLERSQQVGASWRSHYARLHLHTARRHSGLPFVPFPANTPQYPARQQVIDYLDAYARQLSVPPRFGQQVNRVRRRAEHWETKTQDTLYVSDQVVIATGNTRVPYSPEWPGQSTFRGEIRHSSAYRTGAAYRGQRVLVVGLGNSGGEIAIDLWEQGAMPTLAVRGPVTVIPRDLLGVPILVLSILLRRLPARLADALTAPILWAVFGDLRKIGLQPAAEGPFTRIQRYGRIPLLDVGTIALIRQGKIALRPGLASFSPAGVLFSDGTPGDFDAVILATGFRPVLGAFLEEAARVTNAQGEPLVSGGESALPGLYFCGFFVAPSGMLREIAHEARRVALAIANRRPA